MSWILCCATQIPILGQNNLSPKVLEMSLLTFSPLWEFPWLTRDTLKSRLLSRASLHTMTDCYVVKRLPFSFTLSPFSTQDNQQKSSQWSQMTAGCGYPSAQLPSAGSCFFPSLHTEVELESIS